MSRVLPSQVRKKFNRTEFNGSRLNLLDLVRTSDGTIGQYYCVSVPRPRSQSGVPINHGIPSELVVLLYKTDCEVSNREPRIFPVCFEYNGKLIPINYSMISKDITPKRPWGL